MRLIWLFAIGLLFTGATQAASPEALTQGDFAWGLRLEPALDKPFYELPLPLAVYRGVSRSDLGDVRVFNGHGELLPHELLPPQPALPGPEQANPVALFPLYGSRSADLQLLSLRITGARPDGSAVTLERQQLRPTRDEVLRGYLLQLWEDGAQRPALQGLTLRWPAQTPGFIQRLKLEQSADLNRWRPLPETAVIADLAFAGERLVRAEIVLQGVTDRFLRLTPVGVQAMPLELVGVDAVTRGESALRPRESAPIARVQPGEQAGEYRFELPGRLPVREIDLQPAQPNSIARVSLHSRDTPEAPWVSRGQGTIYRLQVDGTTLQQTALGVTGVNDRYWRLQVAGDGLGAETPAIRVSWLPHRLRFAARGEGPFLLAYGSARAGLRVQEPLLDSFSATDRPRLVGERIGVVAPVELAGPAALTRQPVYDWKQWSLWGTLILASLLLGWMAWATLRQMRGGAE